MKKTVFFVFVFLCILFYTIISRNFAEHKNLGLALMTSNKEDQCFDKSYNQISDSIMMHWDSTFSKLEIATNPFAIAVFFIEYFSRLDTTDAEKCFSLNEILSSKKSNLKSSVIATSALMQKLGWDIQCIYNKKEYYLGFNFAKSWEIRKGHWVEKNGKSYYLKEFDDFTPVGKLRLDDPAQIYQSIECKKTDLKTIPLIDNLPKFSGPLFQRRLTWWYQDMKYEITISVPEEQIDWTKNLPASFFGMVSSGVLEVENIDLVNKLKFLLEEFTEYDRVNFLFKFCQSESIFIYDNQQPIKSVSEQLVDGRNDCDGRSVFLYCLLHTVLGYSFSDIIFISWPNHIALGLKPQTEEAEDILKRQNAVYVGDKYYILDAAYCGDTYWGSKMERLSDEYEIIKQTN